MNEEISTTPGGLRKWLDQAEVLHETVRQLQKDLGGEGITLPAANEAAFEALRAEVLGLLERWQRGDPSSVSRAINRVDLTERQVDSAIGRGGLRELAGVLVLRCLQKVLLRKRFAGRA